jgi:hypothetical protein
LVHRFARDTPHLSKQELEEFRQRLFKMSDAELVKCYNNCLYMCQLNSGQPPRAAYPQQLVQAWKELDRRRKLTK